MWISLPSFSTQNEIRVESYSFLWYSHHQLITCVVALSSCLILNEFCSNLIASTDASIVVWIVATWSQFLWM